MKKLIFVILVLSVLPLPAKADFMLSSLGAAHKIDFDTTVSDVNVGVFTGSGFQSAPTTGQLDSDSWAVTGFNDGDLAFGGTRTTGDYARGAMSAAVTTGGIYAFFGGNITTGRTLGIQPAGDDWTPGTLTLRLKNSTGATITSLDLSYLVYVRNDEGRSNTFNFSHSADNSSYTAVSSLDLTSATTADALGFVSNSKSTILTGLSIASGANYFFRWSGDDHPVTPGSGSRDEFSLDDIIVTPLSSASAVPEPGTLGLFCIGMVGCALLSRRNAKAAITRT